MNDDDLDREEDAIDASDYDDERTGEGGVSRWMSLVVVLLAVSGFFGLAWYAYKNGGEPIDEKETELVQADATPVKEAPANPGGMAIPNQDKTVYNLVGGKQEGKVVEHILSSPETPVNRNEDADTSTWMSDQVKDKLKSMEQEKEGGALSADPASKGEAKESEPAAAHPLPKAEGNKPDTAGKAEQFNPVKAHEAPVKPVAEAEPVKAAESIVKAVPVPVEKKDVAKAEPVKTEAPAKAEEKAKAEPVKKEGEKAPEPATKKQETPAAETAAAKEPASAKPPAGARAQLGAFKSQAEAEGEWKKIAKKFASDIGEKNHYIVRADLGSKGTYYRLQLAPFDSSSDVEEFCLTLVGEGQGCFLAKGK